MLTCKVEVEIFVDHKVVKSKMWPACDIMNTSRTRAWATRQFNKFLSDFGGCDIGHNKIITVHWTAIYPDETGRARTHGHLSGVNGKRLVRDGIFEDY
jgi:hypothetical protein